MTMSGLFVDEDLFIALRIQPHDRKWQSFNAEQRLCFYKSCWGVEMIAGETFSFLNIHEHTYIYTYINTHT